MKPPNMQPSVVAPADVHGVVIERPPYGERDPSTGQCISVIKTGTDPSSMMKSLAVPQRSIPKTSQAQDAD